MIKLIKYGIITAMSVFLCCGCRKEPMPSPEYPLSQEVLGQALAEVGFDWTVAEERSMQEGHLFYTLNDQNEKMISILSTASITDESRYLQLAFLSSPTRISTVLPRENWEQAITLAQILYGGFEAEDQINRELARADEEDFVIEDIEASSDGPAYRRIQWKKQICNINCTVIFLQEQENPEKLFLKTIVLDDSDELPDHLSGN